MAQSMFDWEDEEEKVEDPISLAGYEPELPQYQSVPADYQHQLNEYRPETVEYPPEPSLYQSEWAEYKEPVGYRSESAAETSRRGGMAFTAGIVFFSSVVFMLFLGWIADLLLGSSPWGLVGGIVLGSIIGFVQFVRITSQIFNTKKAESAMHPLLPPDDVEH